MLLVGRMMPRSTATTSGHTETGGGGESVPWDHLDGPELTKSYVLDNVSGNP